MSDYDDLHLSEDCGDVETTGRYCRSCAGQRAIDRAESSPSFIVRLEFREFLPDSDYEPGQECEHAFETRYCADGTEFDECVYCGLIDG